MSDVKTVSELRAQVIEKATVDEEFRSRLLAQPKVAIEEELGLKLPDGFTIEVHEEMQDTSHMVLPPFASLGESEMGEVHGGANWSYNPNNGWTRSDEAITFWDDL